MGSYANQVIDISHYNGNVDFAAVKAAGIVGVIHKATQGISYSDPEYAEHREKATDVGLLWGAYHFGVGADGVAQAVHFLETAQLGAQDLTVLDFEADPTGPSMSLVEARAFVAHLYETLGCWPGLYSGHYAKELLGSTRDPVLSQCWLWLAQYGKTPVIQVTWTQWTLWQYTDGAAGQPPHTVAGVGRCDRDKFNGDETALRAFWTGLYRQS